MKFTVENVSTVKKMLHIEIPQEEIVKEIDLAYRGLNKTAKIKGFRPGKVPRSVLERIYQKEVLADVTSKLIQSSLADAIKDSGLQPLRQADINPPELSVDSPYQYSAGIEISPEIPDIDFRGLVLKKSLYKPSEEELTAQLKMLQKNLSERKPIDMVRPVQHEDFVVLDYQGFKDGNPHPDLQKTENMTIKIGTAYITKEFDDNLVGMLPGEQKEFSVVFPENYHNTQLSGQEVDFKVHLQEIREEILPEINDDFAKKLGPFTTMEEAKSAIIKNLEEGYNKRSEQELYEQIFSALIEKTPFDVPDALVDWELSGIIHEIERSLEHRQETLESHGTDREKLAASYRYVAERQAKRHLILDKIISQENLKLSDEDMQSALRAMALTYGQPMAEIQSHYDSHPDQFVLFRQAILEKQAIKLIMDNSTCENVDPVLESQEEQLPV